MYKVRDVTCNRKGLGLNVCVVPPITYLSLISNGENYFWSEVGKEGKTKLRFKTDYNKKSTQCLNKKEMKHKD